MKLNPDQRAIIARINSAFDALYKLDNIGLTPLRSMLFDFNKTDEKNHRSMLDNTFKEHHPNTASITECAKLFTVKHIADALIDPKWEVKDLLRIKKSCIYSQSIVDNYREKIRECWEEQDIDYLSKLDYLSLVDYDLYIKHQLNQGKRS
tara:strand:+ start:62 stop:511 length:450 start_codon:yes stop_codon:yes gene_type:complete